MLKIYSCYSLKIPLFGKEAYGSPIGSEPRLKEEPTAHRGLGEIYT